MKEPTYFKDFDEPTWSDHILTNHLKCHPNFDLQEKGLSNFCKLTITATK